jgi:transposase-like protein
LIHELARHGLQQLIELEVAAFLGADRHERTEERLGYRNGYRPRTLTTQVGDLALQIPKLRAGSFLASILEPRRRVDQALYAVIMEAYIGGVSTRKVDSLVAALGSQSGISKSQVSRICQEIDQQVQAFLSRPLESSSYAYVYLDATYLKGRLGKAQQVCSRAVVVAMGVNTDGRRELLGIKVGDSESETFWAEFISHLKKRGLAGVKLVISDAHSGLTKAIRRQLQGCVWQRCRVHFARNLLQYVPKAHQGMVTAALRSVFAQVSAAEIESRWDDLAASLAERFPNGAALMHEAREDVLAFRHFLKDDWRKIWSTNLLERVNVTPRGALSEAAHQTPHPSGGHLPQRRRDHPPGGGGAAGAARALAAGGPPHVLRREHGDHPGAGRHPCAASTQRLRGAGRRPQVIKAAAPPQGAAALIAARGPAAATPSCTNHTSSQHIRDRTKGLTSHSSQFIVEQRGASAPPE